MPRIPFLAEDLAQPREIVEAIRKRRGGKLYALDRILLHSPPVAAGWNSLMGAVRTQMSLPGKWRELAMCVVAVLNGAEYEFVAHAPIFIEQGGRADQVTAMRDVFAASADSIHFDETERAVIQLTIEMTRTVHVSDATFAAARRQLPNDQQMFELIATVASYNMVSRILVATGIRPEDH